MSTSDTATTEPDDRTRRYLADIVTTCDTASRLTAHGRDAFLPPAEPDPGRQHRLETAETLCLAAEAVIIRAGEAVARIDARQPTFVADRPELPLRELKDARNFIAHGYDRVDPVIMWEILSESLPQARAAISHYLALQKSAHS